MDSLLSDIRFTFRLVRRSPGFFATLLAVLAVGIGATTAMFSIVESLLLKPLPYPHPEQLTMVWATQPRVNPSPVSIPIFLDWRAQATTFDGMAAGDYTAFSLSSDGAKPESLSGAEISGDFFPLIGIRPLYGRFLEPSDDHVGGPRVAVLAAAVWHRRFGSDPSLVGRSITLDGQAYTVVGIAPDGFRFSGPFTDTTDVWVPLAVARAEYASDMTTGRGSHFLNVVGRVRAGVSLEQAQAELSTIARSIEVAHPDTNTKVGVHLVELHEQIVGSSRVGVWVLFAAVVLVFGIVCSNVANLLLTRAQSRRSEMAARAALGATPGRLARQMVTESVVIFLLGSLGGFAIARWLVDVFAAGIVASGASTIDIRLDAMALTFSVVTCFVCGVVFGLFPAAAVARTAPHVVLQESAARASVGRSQRTIRGALVIAQVALACTLLVGSGLALRAFARVAATPPGFDPTNVATARIALPDTRYADDDSVLAFYRDVVAKIAAYPGVQSVAADSTLPMGMSNNNGSFVIEGRPEWPRGDKPILERNVVTPGFFAAMGTPLLRGRDFTSDDRRDGRLVAIISQSAVARFFPGEDPIGHRIHYGDVAEDGTPRWREIVGVVGDVRKRGLDQYIADESYVPLAQVPTHWMFVVARSPHAEDVLHALPTLVSDVDPQQAVTSSMLMSDRVSASIGNQRYVALLLAAFAAASLLLATLGLFGLVSYVTSQRTRELGIRMALGATPGGVVGLVVQGGLRLLAVGLCIGLACAALVGRVLAARVSGVDAFDLLVYAAIPAVLGLAGVTACLVPAWRAVRIPPASALRYE